MGTSFWNTSIAPGPSHEGGIESADEIADEVGVKERVEDRDKNTEIAKVGVEGDAITVEEEVGFWRTSGSGNALAVVVGLSKIDLDADQGSARGAVQGSMADALK